ncbi:MAG: hypothetical protein IJU48_00825 [Synergistaceae bacterium]|nr:hypothetical protein [Synergistaceae bacterium]
MKRFTFGILILILTLTASSAFGKTIDTKYFTLNVPKGWHGEKLNNTSVQVTRDDETASVLIKVGKIGKKTIDEIAKSTAKKYSAEELEQDEDGAYSFTFEEDGKTKIGMLDLINDEVCMLLIQYVENEEALDSLDDVLEGFEMKEEE